MKTPQISLELEPFGLPNFVRLKTRHNSEPVLIPVGTLTEDEATMYWDMTTKLWPKHVDDRRASLREPRT